MNFEGFSPKGEELFLFLGVYAGASGVVILR